MDILALLITAPTGGGKDTQVSMLMKRRFPFKLVRWVSYTTRPPRPDEVHGVDYFFVTEEEFFRLVQLAFFEEYKLIHGAYYYGKPAIANLAPDEVYVTDIDYQGAEELMDRYGDRMPTRYLFIDADTSRQRYLGRCADKGEEPQTSILEQRILTLERKENPWADKQAQVRTARSFSIYDGRPDAEEINEQLSKELVALCNRIAPVGAERTFREMFIRRT